MNGSKFARGPVGFVGAGATLVDGSLVVIGSVEDSWMFVRAFGGEAGHDAFPAQPIRWETSHAKDCSVVRALGGCFYGLWKSLTYC